VPTLGLAETYNAFGMPDATRDADPLSQPAAEPARRARGRRPIGERRGPLRTLPSYLPVAALLAAVTALSFLSGGYIFERTATVAFIALAAAVVWAWLLPRRAAIGLPLAVGLAALALFVAWTGLSIAWSIGPDLSWLAFDVALLYLVVAVVVTVTPAGPGQLRLAGYGYVVAMVPVAAYALLGKTLPDVVTHAHLYARLMAPVGYWNVLAMVMVMASMPAPSPLPSPCSC